MNLSESELIVGLIEVGEFTDGFGQERHAAGKILLFETLQPFIESGSGLLRYA